MTHNKVDKKRMLTVFGYLRQMETCLILSSHIPPLVKQLCLNFYPFEECFALCPKEFEISKDGMTVKRLKSTNYRVLDAYKHSIYLQTPISSDVKAIHRWTLKKEGDIGGIGLTPNPNTRNLNVDIFDCSETSHPDYCPNYAMYDKGWAFRNGKKLSNETMLYFHDNKAVILLDLFRGHFGFEETDGMYFVVFKNIQRSKDIIYRLAAQIKRQGHSLSLVDYCVQYTQQTNIKYSNM